MHVLITGAAGFIGSTLVDRLLARGDSVCGIDNFDPVYSPDEKRANLAGALLNPAFRLIEGDVTDSAIVNRACDAGAVNAIVHLAAKSGVRPSVADPAGYELVNVGGTRAMLAAAARHGIKAFVFTSSSSVYGNHAPAPFREDGPASETISPYASTKQAGEDLCRTHHQAHGGSTWCLRLFTVYGPRQRPDLAMRRFCALMSAGKPVPLFGDGSSERDYTWVDDTVDGVVAALDLSATKAGLEIVNLGSGRSVRLDRLTELLAVALGVTPQVHRLPAQPADVGRTLADITKARRLLGFAPKVTLEDGIARFVSWFRRSPLP